MSSELLTSIMLAILSVPMAIVANILSPKIQDWLDSRNKKMLEKQGQEELISWKNQKERAKKEREEQDDLQIYDRETKILEGNKERFQEETGIILKDRLIITGILYAPVILLIIGVLLNIYESTVFILLFLLSFFPSVHLFIRLIQRFIQILKYKRENKKESKGKIEKLKNESISVGIICLPFVMFFLLDPKNMIHVLLLFLSFFMSFYFIIQSIIRYIQFLNNKSKLNQT